MSNDEEIKKALPEVAESEISSRNGEQQKKAPWWSYFWDYEPGRSSGERKSIHKLDTYLLLILSLGYFIKNIDQANIGNAYVSGIKEDLQMNANEINYVDIAFVTGYVVGQLPSQLILTKVRPSMWIPCCELVWTMLTFCLAAASTSNHVIVIRFFVGLSESIFYPAAHFLIGSWYTPVELSKRATIFHASSAAAGMFSGYLQVAVYKGLNGVHGRAGWQWLFLMDGIISLPICFAGFFFIPDLPENSRVFYLKQEDFELAKARIVKVGRAPRGKLGWSILKRVFGRWHVYALTLLYVTWANANPSFSVNPFALWLKASGYSIAKINIIPTGQGALVLVTTILFGMLSDLLQKREFVLSLVSFSGFFPCLVLAIWAVPSGLKWFSFFTFRMSIAFSPLAMAWANEICGNDAEERAIVLGVMNSMASAFQAWLPLFTYPVKDAPTFRRGFIFSTAAYMLLFGVIAGTGWLFSRETRKKIVEREKGREVAALE